MLCSTIRDILVHSGEAYGERDAVRYKEGKNKIVSKTYREVKEDSERFSAALLELVEPGSHVALTGMTSYTWLVAYLGTVNSGSVAVPLDVSLPAEEICELITRSDAAVFVADDIRKDAAAMALERCPKLKYVISMQRTRKACGLLQSSWTGRSRDLRRRLARSSLRRSCLPQGLQGRAKALC